MLVLVLVPVLSAEVPAEESGLMTVDMLPTELAPVTGIVLVGIPVEGGTEEAPVKDCEGPAV